MSNKETDNSTAIGHDPLAWIKSDGSATEQAGEKTATGASDTDADVCGDIVLSGSLGMAEIDAMHESLVKVLHAHVDITIQSEGLSRVDAAGAQLLYGFVQGAKAQETPLTWTSVSDDLRQTASTLGLSEGMGI